MGGWELVVKNEWAREDLEYCYGVIFGGSFVYGIFYFW